MAGCLSGIAKYLLFIFNFLIVVCGIILIAIGGIVIAGTNSIDGFKAVGACAIAIGVIIFIIAFFGCCGAIKESGCLLTTYAICLIIILILQIIIGVIAFISMRNNDNQFTDTIHDVLSPIWNENRQDDIDSIQQSLKCCRLSKTEGTITDSCYEDNNSRNTLFQDTCTDALKDMLSKYLSVIGGVAIGFAVVELVGVIFACIVKNRR